MDQCEYATDIVFKRQADLAAIYGNLTRTAIHTVKPDNIATFLGRKLNSQYEGEMGNRFNIRIEGTRIKHTMGPVSLKLYDKFGLILRIETTVNDLTFFKHYREVEHRDGTKETKWASMQKTIYSLPALRELLEAANRRYLEFLSTIEDPRNGRDKLDKLSQPVQQEGRSYPGFNLFDPDDEALFCAIARGEFNISGLQNKTLRRFLPDNEQRPGVAPAQTPPPSWPHQEGRPHLQVLPHRIRQGRHRRWPQAPGTRHHPATRRRHCRVTQIFCPFRAESKCRGTNHIPAMLHLAMAYDSIGKFQDATQVLDKAAALTHRIAPTVGLLARVHGLAGDRQGALKLLAELRNHPARSPVLMASAYIGLGQAEDAIDWLEQGFEQRSPFMEELKVSPHFDPLRSHSRFQVLLKKMNWPN